VSIDVGSDEARHLALDGWSPSEVFIDPLHGRTTFAWAVGPESALRVALPKDVQHLALRASPVAAAVGSLRIQIGDQAHANVTLSPGWQVYEAVIVGRVRGGITDVVLTPAGFQQPNPFVDERRELAVAIDFLAFGEGYGTTNRGAWPVRDGSGAPRLFVSDPSVWGPSSGLTSRPSGPQNP
jgi:hypothetical protein